MRITPRSIPERCPACGQARDDEHLLTEGIIDCTTMNDATAGSVRWKCLRCNHEWTAHGKPVFPRTRS